MAIRELSNNGGVYNYPAPTMGESAFLEPGMAVALTTASGSNNAVLVRADRLHIAAGTASIVGLLADYVNGSPSSTFINYDPVGSTYTNGGTLVNFVNAAYSGRRRQAFSYNQSEQLNNVINLTDVGGQGMRGVAVFQAPGQFIIDANAYALFQTSAANADGTAITSFSPGDVLTIGTTPAGTVGGNAGKLVKINPASLADGPAVARVEAWDGSLLTISAKF